MWQFGNLSIRGNFGFGYDVIVRPSEVKPQLVLKGPVVLEKNKTKQSKEKQDKYFIWSHFVALAVLSYNTLHITLWFWTFGKHIDILRP